MEIIVKQGSRKVDHYSRRSGYNEALSKGKRIWDSGGMKFENEAEKRDYLRRVESNPENVLGLPTFFPPVRIKPMFIEEGFLNFNHGYRYTSSKMLLGCENCRGLRDTLGVNRVTEHVISHNNCFCTVCGKEKPYRMKFIERI